MKSARLRSVAVVIMAPAILFWLWFGIASAAGERLGAGNWVLHVLIPGGVLLVSTIVALRFRRAGGAILAIEGLAVAVVYPILTVGRFPASTVALVLATMALPPLAADALFVLSARDRPTHRT